MVLKDESNLDLLEFPRSQQSNDADSLIKYISVRWVSHQNEEMHHLNTMLSPRHKQFVHNYFHYATYQLHELHVSIVELATKP
jgi:hypothetical protein